MKVLGLASVLLSCTFARTAIADCQYWDGTAPWCAGSCPSNCQVVQTSNSGNGGSCWTGSKVLCNCCPGPGPCTPTETQTACYGGVLICKNVEHIFGPEGDQTVTCSTYACGVCFGFSPFLGSDEVSMSKRTMTIKPTHTDIVIRGANSTEEEMEDMLVSKFGPKLSEDDMRNVTVVRIAPPAISLVRGSQDCPRAGEMATPKVHFQSPPPYYE